MRYEKIYKRDNGTIVRVISIGAYDVINSSFEIDVFAAVQKQDETKETFIYSRQVIL